jgi:hypothetical protein
MKTRPMGAEIVHADEQTDRQTYMIKLMVAFHNFVNTPKHLLMLFMEITSLSSDNHNKLINTLCE